MFSLLSDTFDMPVVSDVVTHLGYGGKSLRPKLAFASALLCGYEGEGVALLAKSVEYIHMASLFHDDVIDEGHTRRGKTCAHRVWGNRTAILVGDFLINHVFSLLLTLDHKGVMQCAHRALRDLIEGQLQENTLSVNTSLEAYLVMTQKKTSSLFSFACTSVGILAQRQAHTCEVLQRFGCFFGQAFQMIDDVLDYVPGLSVTKTVGQDWGQKKVTMPLFLAYEKADAYAQKAISEAFAAEESEAFEHLRALIIQHGGIERSVTIARSFAEKALHVLSTAFEDSLIAASGLPEMAESIFTGV